ncbi:MAG: tetratricopeptide repeat protein [bacterium]
MYLLTRTLMILTFFLVLLPLQSEIHANDDGIAKGIALYEAGNLNEAKEFFEAFVKDHPENAEGYYYLGRILFDENKFKDAERQLEKAVKLKSNHSYYHLWLGRASGRRAQSASIFKKPGLAKKAKKHFEIAVQLDDNNVEAKEDLIAYYTQAPGIMGGSTERLKRWQTDYLNRINFGATGHSGRFTKKKKNMNRRRVTIKKLWPISQKI